VRGRDCSYQPLLISNPSLHLQRLDPPPIRIRHW
jgi:hypothetical protein